MRPARRRFLGAWAALAVLPQARAAVREQRLSAAPARLPVVGAPHPASGLWSYNGSFPGPEIRLRFMPTRAKPGRNSAGNQQLRSRK